MIRAGICPYRAGYASLVIADERRILTIDGFELGTTQDVAGVKSRIVTDHDLANVVDFLLDLCGAHAVELIIVEREEPGSRGALVAALLDLSATAAGIEITQADRGSAARHMNRQRLAQAFGAWPDDSREGVERAASMILGDLDGSTVAAAAPLVPVVALPIGANDSTPAMPEPIAISHADIHVRGLRRAGIDPGSAWLAVSILEDTGETPRFRRIVSRTLEVGRMVPCAGKKKERRDITDQDVRDLCAELTTLLVECNVSIIGIERSSHVYVPPEGNVASVATGLMRSAWIGGSVFAWFEALSFAEVRKFEVETISATRVRGLLGVKRLKDESDAAVKARRQAAVSSQIEGWRIADEHQLDADGVSIGVALRRELPAEVPREPRAKREPVEPSGATRPKRVFRRQHERRAEREAVGCKCGRAHASTCSLYRRKDPLVRRCSRCKQEGHYAKRCTVLDATPEVTT